MITKFFHKKNSRIGKCLIFLLLLTLLCGCGKKYSASEFKDKLVVVLMDTSGANDVKVNAVPLSDGTGGSIPLVAADGGYVGRLDPGTYRITVTTGDNRTAYRMLTIDDSSLYLVSLDLNAQ